LVLSCVYHHRHLHSFLHDALPIYPRPSVHHHASPAILALDAMRLAHHDVGAMVAVYVADAQSDPELRVHLVAHKAPRWRALEPTPEPWGGVTRSRAAG